MPVLPLVGSMMIVSGPMRPSRSAASIIAAAIRSFTLQSGFMFSILPAIVATQPSVTRRSRTSGVRPMHCVMSSRIPAGSVDMIMEAPTGLRGTNPYNVYDVTNGRG